jgi:hypothetical protein
MVLQEGYLKDENNLKFIWDLTWVKHLKCTLMVARLSHSQKE